MVRGVVTESNPRALADLILGLAVRTEEPIYVEPVGEHYALRIERGPLLVDLEVDPGLAKSAIARLAFIADLDLASPRATSAAVPVRCEDRERDVIITIRAAHLLRADVVVLRDPRERSLSFHGNLVEGDTVGSYRVTKLLGEGGMGRVYHVVHTSLERAYALKVLRDVVIERDPAATQQFLREARLAARIHHPNIVDVVDFGHLDDGRPYLVMELLEGESLERRVARGALPPDEVVAIARQLASALAAAHEVGVIHADVTPANVLTSGDQVKLVDFGLARLRSEIATTREDTVLGTPAYIAPEQIRGQRATEQSDQYGLGAVLYHLLVGVPPFRGADVRATCKMHLEAPIPPVESPLGPLPGRLGEIVTRCLQKSPQSRFPDMRALLAALDETDRVARRRDWTRWLER
jgi:serine/threonine protein kinase